MAVFATRSARERALIRPNLLAVSQPLPAFCLRAPPKLRRLINNRKNQTRHGTYNSFLRFKENTQGLFARPSLYVKLDLQFVRQLNSIGTDYGLLISIKNTMTFTMT